MIKLFGALLILCACGVIGYIPVWQMQQRITLLDQLERDLSQMCAELHTSFMSIPELMEVIAEQSGHMTKPMYTAVLEAIGEFGPACFSEVWAESTQKTFICLTEQECRKLCDVGMVLGMYVLEDELAMLADILAYLHNALTHEKIHYSEKSKVSVSLAASIGLFFVIALV